MKVKDLFSINKEFSRFELIAGEKGLERTITDIDVFEIPDGIHWAEGGEFAITTGYYFKDQPKELLKMVEVLNQKKSAGMGIKLGRFIDSLPQEVVDYANEVGFPLLSIPINLGYGSIIWPIVSSLLSENTYKEYVLSKFRLELEGIKGNRVYFKEIILMMSNYLHSDVYVLDSDQFNIIKSIPIEDDFLQIKEILNGESNYSQSDSVCRRMNGKYYRIYQIFHHGALYGHFGLVSNDYNVELEQLEKQIISEVSAHIVIYILSLNKRSNEVYASSDELFRELIKGSFEGDNIRLREEAKLLSLDYSLNRIVMVIKDIGSCQVTEKKIILDLLNRALSGRAIGVYSFEENDKLISVISLAVMDRENIQRICKKIILQGNQDKLTGNLSIGISKECKSLKYIRAAYEEAEFSQRLGSVLNQTQINFYDDYIVYHMMTKLHNHPSVMKLYKNIIVKLRAEKGSSEELIDTIKCLVRNNFNITKASEELFLHRNSLYKRIGKIQEIIGYDFEQSDTKFILNMVSKLDDLIS